MSPSRIDMQVSLGAQRYTNKPAKVPAHKREAIRAAEAVEVARVREEMKRLKEQMYARNPHLRSDAA